MGRHSVHAAVMVGLVMKDSPRWSGTNFQPDKVLSQHEFRLPLGCHASPRKKVLDHQCGNSWDPMMAHAAKMEIGPSCAKTCRIPVIETHGLRSIAPWMTGL